jgi:cytochrome c-type biogenesis protein
MGNTFAGIAESGPLLLAIGVAAIAGLVSFLSPCVLPLVPGYLSYVTGLAGADLDSASASGARRGRVLAGTLLFVAGFASVFVLANVLLASAGRALLRQQRTVEIVVGILVIVLGAAFAGLIPGLQREWRIHRLPAAGLLGAPVFGAVFALSWSPCLGPTLGVVLGLSAVGGSTGRAVILAFAYCLGLGLPFVAFGLGFRRLLGVFRAIRRNSMWITRLGGVLLIIVGLALVTGGWFDFVNWLRATVGVGEVSI